MSLIGGVFNKITGKKSGKINLHNMYDLGAGSMTSPVSADFEGKGEKIVICATIKGDVFALDSDFKLKWKFKASSDASDVDRMFMDSEMSDGVVSPPKIFDIDKDGKKEIIFGTEQGDVFALNYKGELLWKFSSEGPVRGGINVFYFGKNKDVKIIFGSLDQHIYILNHKGKLEKMINAGVGIESTPVIFDDLIILGTDNGEVRAYDALGKLSWNYKTNSKITSEAVPLGIKTDDGTKCFVIGSTNNSIYCFTTKGKLSWAFETAGSIYSKAIVIDVDGDGVDEIIFGAADNKVHVLSPEGTELWNFETDFWIIGTPVAIDIDKDGAIEIVAGSYDTNVYFLTAEGAYVVEYVPGISGIVAQSGSYSDIPTSSPGNVFGKKIWEYRTPGIVIGCCAHNDMVVVQTKEGKVLLLKHEE